MNAEFKSLFHFLEVDSEKKDGMKSRDGEDNLQKKLLCDGSLFYSTI